MPGKRSRATPAIEPIALGRRGVSLDSRLHVRGSFAVNQERGLAVIEADVLVDFQAQVGGFQVGVTSGDEGSPLGILHPGLVELQTVHHTGTGTGGGDEETAFREVRANVVEHCFQIILLDMLHDFPGRDQMELELFCTKSNLERFGDVGGKEIGTGQGPPVRALMFERVIGAFDSYSDPANAREIRDQLSSGTAQIHAGEWPGGKPLAEQPVHQKHEFAVGAVIVFRAVGNEVIR